MILLLFVAAAKARIEDQLHVDSRKGNYLLEFPLALQFDSELFQSQVI